MKRKLLLFQLINTKNTNTQKQHFLLLCIKKSNLYRLTSVATFNIVRLNNKVDVVGFNLYKKIKLFK